MTRIFLSHSSKNNAQAIALKKWLVQQDPPLAQEIFLDQDKQAGLRAGTKWLDALRQASNRAEAVICLLSAAWEASDECKREFHYAEILQKRIICARIEPTNPRRSNASDITRDWQRVNLFVSGPQTPKVAVDIVDTHDQPITVEFSVDGLQRLKREIIGKRVGPESFLWPHPDYPDRAPYRGWQPLEEIDAGVFYGRDTEMLRALDELRRMRAFGGTRLFVILAASGAGKSSFLRAGLLPRLRRDDRDFMPLETIRPERNVLTGRDGFAAALHRTRERLGLKEPELGEIKRMCLTDAAKVTALLREVQQEAVRQFIGQGEQDPPTMVVPIDQCEELFGKNAGTEADRFLSMVAEWAGEQPPGDDLSLIVAVTIRTDRHHDLQDAQQLIGVDSVTFADLKAMPPHQFREVILGPARRASEGGQPLEVESSLVDELVKECSAGGDALPLLALTLARLHADYGSDGDLLLREYTDMGGLREVVTKEIDDLLSRDTAERQRELDLLRQAFIPYLVSFDSNTDLPVRRVADWDEIPVEARPLLGKFVGRRLLVHRDGPGDGVVEVALESLFRQWDDLKTWLDEEREDLVKAAALERNAADWTEHHSGEEWLLSGERLTDAENLLGRTDFAKRLAGARTYIEKSRVAENAKRDEQVRHERIRWRAGILAIAVAILIVCLVVGYASLKSRNAEEQQRNRAALTLTSNAEQMLQGQMAGGDTLALQLLLAAKSLGAPDSAILPLADSRRDLLRIVDNPQSISVSDAAISPDGRYVGWIDINGNVRVWTIASNEAPRQLPARTHFTTVAFTPRGQLATGSADGDVLLWNPSGMEQDKPLPIVNAGNEVRGLAFSRDGNWTAAQDKDGVAHVWNRTTGYAETYDPERDVPTTSVNPPQGRGALAFSPDGRILALGSTDSKVRLLGVGTGPITLLNPGPPGGSAVLSIAFSNDGKYVAAGRENGSIALISSVGEARPATHEFPEYPDNARINSVAFSPDHDDWLIAGSDNGTIQVWDVHTGRPVGQPFVGHHGAVTSVRAFRAENRDLRIMSGSADGSIRIWDASFVVPYATGQRGIRSVAFGPQGTIVAGCPDGALGFWDIGRTGADPTPSGDTSNPGSGCVSTATSQQPVIGNEQAIAGVAVDPQDSSQLVSAGADGQVKLWRVSNPTPILFDDGGSAGTGRGRIMALAFSRDGSLVVTGGFAPGDSTQRKGMLQLWDMASRKRIKAASTDYPILSVAFGRDGPDTPTIATGSGNLSCNCVQLWDTDLNPLGEPRKGHPNGMVFSVAFSPDGRYLVSGHSDGQIGVWDLTAGPNDVLVLNGDQSSVVSVAFSNDDAGKWIVSGDNRGRVQIWDRQTRQPIGGPFASNPTWITTVTFNRDNTLGPCPRVLDTLNPGLSLGEAR